jgi:single-strand DNA-binding protein
MLELNKIMLIGNLTRDPELSYLPTGTALAKIGLAVNRSWKDKSGQWQRETSFFDVDAWSQSAEFAAKYLKKGSRIFVEGTLRQHSWESQDGSKRSQVRINVERIQFADGPRDNAAAPAADGGGYQQPAVAPQAAAPQGGYAPRAAAPQPAPSQPTYPTSFPGGNESSFSPNPNGNASQDNTADDLPF